MSRKLTICMLIFWVLHVSIKQLIIAESQSEIVHTGMDELDPKMDPKLASASLLILAYLFTVQSSIFYFVNVTWRK